MEIENWKNENMVISGAENQEISRKGDERFFDGVGTEKVDALKKSISEINEMIHGREGLSKHIFEEGEKLKKEIDLMISENERTPLLDRRDVMKENSDLKHKKIAIAELQLNEKISCWKDIALLKKEMRENERELTEKEARLNLFTDILAEN